MTSDERDPNATGGTEPVGEPAVAPRPPTPAPPYAPAPPQAAAPPQAPTYPFAPRYREPWINPAKRTPAVLLAAAGAVVVLLLGLLIGLGLGGGHDRGIGPRFEPRGPYAYERPGHGYGMPRFRHPGYGPPFAPRPVPRGPSGVASTPATSPVPSSSHR